MEDKIYCEFYDLIKLDEHLNDINNQDLKNALDDFISKQAKEINK